MTKTLLIVIGLLAALLTAAGIMFWHNSPINTALRQLHDQDPFIRQTAIDVLGKLDVKEAIPKIINLLSDNDPNVRGSAVDTLGTLRAKTAIPDITKLLKDNTPWVRGPAVQALKHLDAKEAITEIKQLLNDKNERVRKVAEWALKKLGVTAEDIKEAKIKATIDGLFNDFMNEKFIAPRSPIMNGWIMTLPSGKEIVRSELWEQAEPIIACGTEAVPHLFKWLKTDNLPVRYIAIYSLQQITGITPDTPIFASKEAEKDSKDIEEAIVEWQEWYDNQKKEKK